MNEPTGWTPINLRCSRRRADVLHAVAGAVDVQAVGRQVGVPPVSAVTGMPNPRKGGFLRALSDNPPVRSAGRVG
jgi:hypothetical protein